MDWKELGTELLGQGLPMLGTALMGPAGGAAGALVAKALGIEADPAKVSGQLVSDPTTVLALRELESRERVQLAELAARYYEAELNADARQVEAVNTTMQAEAKSEHWPQWAWRPFNGFMFGCTVFLVYFALPATGKPVPAVPVEVWIMWGAILGVTAWGRNREKNLRAGDQPAGPLWDRVLAQRR